MEIGTTNISNACRYKYCYIRLDERPKVRAKNAAKGPFPTRDY